MYIGKLRWYKWARLSFITIFIVAMNEYLDIYSRPINHNLKLFHSFYLDGCIFIHSILINKNCENKFYWLPSRCVANRFLIKAIPQYRLLDVTPNFARKNIFYPLFQPLKGEPVFASRTLNTFITNFIKIWSAVWSWKRNWQINFCIHCNISMGCYI